MKAVSSLPTHGDMQWGSAVWCCCVASQKVSFRRRNSITTPAVSVLCKFNDRHYQQCPVVAQRGLVLFLIHIFCIATTAWKKRSNFVLYLPVLRFLRAVHYNYAAVTKYRPIIIIIVTLLHCLIQTNPLLYKMYIRKTGRNIF